MKKLSPNQFAWEFLRRNSDYQADFIRSMSFEMSYEELEPGVSVPAGYVEHARYDAMCSDWGVSFLQDPQEDSTSVFDKQYLPLPYASGGEGNLQSFNLAQIEPKVGEITIKFDLSLPLKPQLRAAEQILKRQGEPLNSTGFRQQAKLYPCYILLLDAEHAEAQPKEQHKAIFETFGEDIGPMEAKKIRNRLSEAKKMCESGYRILSTYKG
jgi:hypothetical protein